MSLLVRSVVCCASRPRQAGGMTVCSQYRLCPQEATCMWLGQAACQFVYVPTTVCRAVLYHCLCCPEITCGVGVCSGRVLRVAAAAAASVWIIRAVWLAAVIDAAAHVVALPCDHSIHVGTATGLTCWQCCLMMMNMCFCWAALPMGNMAMLPLPGRSRTVTLCD